MSFSVEDSSNLAGTVELVAMATNVKFLSLFYLSMALSACSNMLSE